SPQRAGASPPSPEAPSPVVTPYGANALTPDERASGPARLPRRSRPPHASRREFIRRRSGQALAPGAEPRDPVPLLAKPMIVGQRRRIGPVGFQGGHPGRVADAASARNHRPGAGTVIPGACRVRDTPGMATLKTDGPYSPSLTHNHWLGQ